MNLGPFETGRVHCFDSLEAMGEIPGDSVASVITDPPYSGHVHDKQWIGHALTKKGRPRCSTAHKGLGFASLTDSDRAAFLAASARLARRWTLAFCDLESVGAWKQAIESHGLDYVRACIWDKVDGAPQFSGDRPACGAEAIVLAHRPGRKKWNGGGGRNVFRYPVNGRIKGPKPHPSTKPVALMATIVRLFTDPGELVIDPFAGSGTTGVACVHLGREFIGFEKVPESCRIANERLEAARENLDLRDYKGGQGSLFGEEG